MHASRGTESSERLLRRLREVGTEIALFNRRVAASMGIREADLVVLDVVHRTGPASPSQLSACTGIHAATMTGILTRLEDDGWIERLPAPGDRRERGSARGTPNGWKRPTPRSTAASSTRSPTSTTGARTS